MRSGAIAILWCTTLLFSLSGCGAGGSPEEEIPPPPGATATLAWDPVIEGTAGYRVYWGTASHQYDYRDDVGPRTSHTITNLQHGTTYFFAVTAYNLGGESPYSSEVSAAFP